MVKGPSGLGSGGAGRDHPAPAQYQAQSLVRSLAHLSSTLPSIWLNPFSIVSIWSPHVVEDTPFPSVSWLLPLSPAALWWPWALLLCRCLPVRLFSQCPCQLKEFISCLLFPNAVTIPLPQWGSLAACPEAVENPCRLHCHGFLLPGLGAEQCRWAAARTAAVPKWHLTVSAGSETWGKFLNGQGCLIWKGENEYVLRSKMEFSFSFRAQRGF